MYLRRSQKQITMRNAIGTEIKALLHRKKKVKEIWEDDRNKGITQTELTQTMQEYGSDTEER